MTKGRASSQGALDFELKNDLAEMPVLVEQLEGFCEQHGIGPDVRSVVSLALEEIVTNIIANADADDGHCRIRVDLSHDGVDLTARVEFDAKSAPLQQDPDVALGLHLVRTLMDEVTYSCLRGRNVLRLKRTIAPA